MMTEQHSAMIVEEDGDLCDIIKVVLSKTYCVQTAHSAAEAHSILRDRCPALFFISDTVSGATLIEFVRDIRGRHAGAVIVVLASPLFKNDRDVLIRTGADLFLMKPFLIKDITDVMDAMTQFIPAG